MASQVRGQPQPHPTSQAAPLAQGPFPSSQEAPEARPCPFQAPVAEVRPVLVSSQAGLLHLHSNGTSSHDLEVCLHHQFILTHS